MLALILATAGGLAFGLLLSRPLIRLGSRLPLGRTPKPLRLLDRIGVPLLALVLLLSLALAYSPAIAGLVISGGILAAAVTRRVPTPGAPTPGVVLGVHAVQAIFVGLTGTLVIIAVVTEIVSLVPTLAATPRQWRATLGRRAAPVLAASLRHPSETVRKEAILGLRGLGGDAPLLLASAIWDRDRGVRSAAAEALSTEKDNRVVPRLAAVFESKDAALRKLIIETLRKFGTSPADRALMREWGRRPLESMGGLDSETPLLEAAFAASKRAAGEAVAALRDAAATDEATRAGAAAAAGCRPTAEGVESLFQALHDPSPRVRAFAARGASRAAMQDRREALRWMHAVLADPSMMAAVPVDSTFGGLSLGRLATELVRLLGDATPDVRSAACSSVGMLLDDEALWAGHEYNLDDPDLRVNVPFRSRLIGSLVRTLEDPESSVQRAAAVVLAGAGDRRAVPTLLRLDREFTEAGPCSICEALRSIGAREPVHFSIPKAFLAPVGVQP